MAHLVKSFINSLTNQNGLGSQLEQLQALIVATRRFLYFIKLYCQTINLTADFENFVLEKRPL